MKKLKTKSMILGVHQLAILCNKSSHILVAKNNERSLFPHEFENVQYPRMTSLTCLVVDGLDGLVESQLQW